MKTVAKYFGLVVGP